jgi:outer membrane autotransporter protein
VGYTGARIELTFDPFYPESTQVITVRTLNDDVFSEGPETITFTISQCLWDDQVETAGSCPTGSSATVTIVDTTQKPTATIVATDPNASKVGSDPGEFTVSLSEPAPSPGIEVGFSVSGTAVPGTDYVQLPGKVLIPAGQTQATIPVTPKAGSSQGDTTVVATLTQGANYDIGNPSSAEVRIAGILPMATIEATDPDASKAGPDPGQFTVRLSSAAPPSGLTVAFSTGGSAVPNRDFSALGGSVTIAQGQTSANIPVTPIAGTSTGTKTVIVTLSSAPGYAVGQPSNATVNITDKVVALTTLSGNGQVASTGVPLQPFVVAVTSGGSPTAGVPILWTLVSGKGALASGRTLTDAQGRASTVLTPSGNGEFVVKAQVEGSDQSVTFTALFNPLSSLPGLTGPQRSMATTLDTLCPKLSVTAGQRALTAGEQDLLTQCRALISSSVSNPNASAQGIAALTPEQASAPRKLTTQITGAQIDNITTRLTGLRRGERGISLRNLTVSMDRQGINGNTVAGALKPAGHTTGGGASADDTNEFERLGIFVNGNIDWGSKDRSANEDGFDFNTKGITAGIDYRFLEGLVLGLAFGYGNSDANIDANGGDIGANVWSSTLYGTYYATDHFYVEGSGAYGWGNYDQTRNISYSLLGSPREAEADYGGNQYTLMFGAGYDFVRGPGILDVYGRLRYVSVDLDGYTEHGASGLDLNIGSQEATSFMSILGLNYTGSISLAKVVLVPQGWFEWLHEYENGDNPVTGVFANDPNRIPFVLATDSFDKDSFRIGLGLGAQFGKGRTAFVTYEARLGLNNYTEQSANIGIRLDF